MLKKTGFFFIALCVIAVFTLILLMNLGYLGSKKTILFAWLIAAIVVGTYSVSVIILYTRRIEKISSKFELTQQLLHEATNPEKIWNIKKESYQEIERIRAENSNDIEIDHIFCNPKFRGIVKWWDRPDAIATFHSFSSLYSLCNKYLEKDFSKPILHVFFKSLGEKKSIFERFNEDVGCWYSNEKNDTPSIDVAYANLRTADTILKIYKKKRTIENLASVLGEDRIVKFKKYFTQKCFDKKTGGFKELNENEATVSSTGLGIRIAVYLFGENTETIKESNLEKIFKFQNNQTPSEFIKHSMSSYSLNGSQGLGFKENPDDEESPKVCIGYFAVAALEKIGKLRTIMTEENQELITSFLDACFKKDTNGYSADPEYETDDLMHTYYALRTAEMIHPEYLKKKSKKFYLKLSEFLQSCRSDRGYSFRRRYEPNVFTTCVARILVKLINRYNRNEIVNFEAMNALKFYISCFSAQENAFAGYQFDIPTSPYHMNEKLP